MLYNQKLQILPVLLVLSICTVINHSQCVHWTKPEHGTYHLHELVLLKVTAPLDRSFYSQDVVKVVVYLLIHVKIMCLCVTNAVCHIIIHQFKILYSLVVSFFRIRAYVGYLRQSPLMKATSSIQDLILNYMTIHLWVRLLKH